MEATVGLEPTSSGFADRRVNQLRHVATHKIVSKNPLDFKRVWLLV
ncbi:MAG: hypothetical protein UU40_C0005G0019 [Candidatus Uhrbacteria bacterium GW2011_GWD2_41_121]|uniref:Uncharacterized protein n=1 Tax=Candidatus Uhrbacteria bacterium GW2011_GWC1_41_20 TaxID=1618983 RepID=A0A0G0YGM4_9BACT|nr:MAG: hypothetical protein UT52_C0007G0019 [Candidatus Uhrbacteria bacterium GW2011_GWE1_39_46]KKR64155.1 MAG: hypothetical protein UU04_C0005G0019 [Candidatus Uhrbacteria bacterium GW2011_GWC2_40_450]KKR90290.1 MAG: hypothetical protein UU40_C0005G0019 [Candidatus Uhrbacteria bacterium GW2011_GWD2_41_121]KKR99512.1 MAG: hypothetical protein UU50_C0005G0019 [Candidatus Uhrbacteria bacterium GW2011_GWC1_41_20]KKS06163.1 MAG: hypothetical protein UU60_C0005G0019 [Candidatus Uhrbacteria bacteriu